MRGLAAGDVHVFGEFFVAAGEDFVFFAEDFYLFGVGDGFFLQFGDEVFHVGNFCLQCDKSCFSVHVS